MTILQRLNYGSCRGRECDIPAVPDSPALVLNDIRFRYPRSDKFVLDGVSLAVNAGERVAMVGPNGAGKSTLLHIIIGMEEGFSGSIDVYGNPAHTCRHRVAIVPQRSDVDWRFPVTVRQVVMMGRYVHLGWFRRPRQEDQDRVEQALATMGISSLAGRQVGELSGGQQQRVMLARTLAHDADLLLMDEPLNHVDIATQELIFHTLERLTAAGKTVIVSTHDLGVLTVHFNRAVFLDRKIIADGKVEDVMTPETVAKAYGFEFHKDYTK
jgi:ABC-type Mn2+/Zn2+ transport system ATPase subunit